MAKRSEYGHGAGNAEEVSTAARRVENKASHSAGAFPRKLAHDVLSVALAALLVLTMNPLANDLSAFAAPSDEFAGGGGSQ